jgi:C_GCAxxG_C_C family probable redox protein
MSKVKIAAEKHRKGYNCAQAVTCSFCEEIDIDENVAMQISKKYGGGAYQICGAVIGMYIVSNFISGERDFQNPAEWKTNNGEQLIALEKSFKDKNGSVICSELRGLRGNGVLRSCRGCIEDAAEIVEELLLERSKKDF